MTWTTKEVPITTMRKTEVALCDGPGCTKEWVELARPTFTIDEDWIILTIPTSVGWGRYHFHSMACLRHYLTEHAPEYDIRPESDMTHSGDSGDSAEESEPAA